LPFPHKFSYTGEGPTDSLPILFVFLPTSSIDSCQFQVVAIAVLGDENFDSKVKDFHGYQLQRGKGAKKRRIVVDILDLLVPNAKVPFAPILEDSKSSSGKPLKGPRATLGSLLTTQHRKVLWSLSDVRLLRERGEGSSMSIDASESDQNPSAYQVSVLLIPCDPFTKWRGFF
jgi:hypothetical protein